MQDQIIYIPSLKTLITNLLKNNPEFVDNSDPNNPDIVGLDRTPAVTNSNNPDEMMAYVRRLPAAWSNYSQDVQVLAEAPYDPSAPGDAVYKALFADSNSKSVYDKVYPRTPVTYTDASGTQQTYTPPQRFGVMG